MYNCHDVFMGLNRLSASNVSNFWDRQSFYELVARLEHYSWCKGTGKVQSRLSDLLLFSTPSPPPAPQTLLQPRSLCQATSRDFFLPLPFFQYTH